MSAEVRWQPLFLDFARYWGFVPRLCHAYRPQTKGKVESGIKHVRRNFLCGRTATSSRSAPATADLDRRSRAPAGARDHPPGGRGSLAGRAGAASSRWRVAFPFPYGPEVVRRVSRDAYVSYQSNRYPRPGRRRARKSRCGSLEHRWRSGRAARCSLPTRGVGRSTRSSRCPATTRDCQPPRRDPPAPRRGSRSPVEPEVEVRSLAAYEALSAAPIGAAARATSATSRRDHRPGASRVGEPEPGGDERVVEARLEHAAQGEQAYGEFLVELLECEVRARRERYLHPDAAGAPARGEDPGAVRLRLPAEPRRAPGSGTPDTALRPRGEQRGAAGPSRSGKDAPGDRPGRRSRARRLRGVFHHRARPGERPGPRPRGRTGWTGDCGSISP